MPDQQMTIVYRYDRLSVGHALSGIINLLNRHSISLDGFSLYEKSINLKDAATLLATTECYGFLIRRNDFEFDLTSIGNHSLDFLSIKTTVPQGQQWNWWIAEFATSPDFVQAWVADTEYEFWQSTEEQDTYSFHGRSFVNLPTKSNGKPAPLERTIIDISDNPGRRILRRGYIEAVGALMWLGEVFWSLTAANKERIRNVDWIELSTPIPNVTRVKAAEECFTAPDGLGGARQRNLRELLFPSSVGA